MTMDDQNMDWLDRRLAADKYVPDDGFTALVVSRVPKTHAASLSLRNKILFLTGFLAVCLFAVQFFSLVRGATHMVPRFFLGDTPGYVLAYIQQPMVLYGVAGGVILLAFAAIPFLRRWA